MWHDVIVDVTRQVTSNFVVEVAQRVSDIVSSRLNDKFIVKLHASEERQKKQCMMDNQA